MRPYLLSLIILGSLSLGFASGPALNRPYVQSGCEGVFYARCIPSSTSGSSGFTDIYKVDAEKDKIIDHYNWYTRGTLILGWSPIAGKVAVMAIHRGRQNEFPAPDQRREFSFYLGGELLRHWTTGDLAGLGAPSEFSKHEGNHAVYEVLGCNQIPRTNEYMFVIKMGGKEMSFDILTGELYKK